MNSKQSEPQLRVATSQARVDAKDTGVATLGPVRIFNRKEDPQPLRRKPTLIEKIFPTMRFRRDLAEREDALNTRIAEIEKNQQKLDEQKKEFAKIISSTTHDMKTPLTTIKGFTGVLEESDLDADSQKMIKQIYRGAITLEGMVEDILLFNKLEHGAIELKRENYALTEQIRQLIDGNRKYSSCSGIEITLNASDGIQAYGDRMRLERVFGNLLSNAIKYGKSRVTITIDRTADATVVSMFDDGKDMDEEVRRKIFKGQEMVTTDLINGNGFGLTNSKKIVDMHGGCIRLESNAGKGKTFIVEIPVR